MEKQKDYTQYTFKPNEKLEVNAPILGILRQFAEEVLNKEGVGIFRATSPRFEYIHRETGLPSKPNTSKVKLDKDYTKVFSLDKTIAANTDEFLLDLGKRALSVINLLNSVHKDNVDGGRAVLRSELEAEIAKEQNNNNLEVVKDKKIILDTLPETE